MQLKTQPWCQRGILRGRPRVPHHTRKGPEWWGWAKLRYDVMPTFPRCFHSDTGFLFVPPPWNILTHTHAFGLYPVLILVGIARVL